MNQGMCGSNIPSYFIDGSHSLAVHFGFSRGHHPNGGMSVAGRLSGGRAVALHRATNSLDKYLKFIAAQADASIADVRSDGYRHRRRFGACNA